MRGQGGAWSLVCGLWAPGDPQFECSLPVACGALSRATVEFPSCSWEQVMENKLKTKKTTNQSTKEQVAERVNTKKQAAGVNTKKQLAEGLDRPPHPDCAMSKEELKKMGRVLPTKKLRNTFFLLTYRQGMNPETCMKNMLSDPEVRDMLDDYALTGPAPHIPEKFRDIDNRHSSGSNSNQPNWSKPDRVALSNQGNRGRGLRGGPPRREPPGPPGRDPSGLPGPPPRDEQSFKQQCQRLISNIGNFGAAGMGMIPLAVPRISSAVDRGRDWNDEPQRPDMDASFQDQPGPHRFGGRQPRPGQDFQDRRISAQRGPPMGGIADLPGVDGPLKNEYQRLLNNVNKIGGFGNINFDMPPQNNPSTSSGRPPPPEPGPTTQKRKSFHDQHSEPKRGRFTEESGTSLQGPAAMRQNNQPDPHMPARMQPRRGQNREARGNMPPCGDEFHCNLPQFNNGPQGNMPPFNNGPQGNMPPFNNGPQGNMPPFNNGPQGNMPSFNDGPHGSMAPFSDGPRGNMPQFNDGPLGNMPPLNHGPQGNMPPFNNGPHGNRPPFNNGPHGNMAPFNDGPHGNMPPFNNGLHGNMPPFNSGPRGNMPPFNDGPQGNMDPFNNRPQGSTPPFNNGPHGNMPPFNSGPHGNMPPFNNGPQGNMPPFNNEPQGNVPPFNNGPQGNVPPFDSGSYANMPPVGNEHHGSMRPFTNADHGNMHPGQSRGNPSGPPLTGGQPPMEQLQHRPSDFRSSSRGMPPSRAPDTKPPKRSATREDISRIDGDPTAPLFIVPTRYPSERFSEEQMDAIENSILEAILDIDDERLKPTFQESFRNNGRYGVICNDQLSKNWLFSYLSRCQPWPYASFKIISAEPTKVKADAILPLCKNDSNDKILKFIGKQNTKLNFSKWEVVQRLDGVCNTSLSLAIDEDSANVLKNCSTINFKMGRAEIVVAEGPKANPGQSSGPRVENEPPFGRSHPEHRGIATHPEQRMSSNQKARDMHEARLGMTGRGPGPERTRNVELPRFDRPGKGPVRAPRDMVQLPTPPPPSVGDPMRMLERSPEYEGASEYEPSRSDRFFRTPSPEPRQMPTSDARERSWQGDPNAQQQLHRIPKSGGHIERDHFTVDRSIPVLDSNRSANMGRGRPSRGSAMDSSSSGAVLSNRIPTIDGNSRRDRPSLNIPGRSNRPDPVYRRI